MSRARGFFFIAIALATASCAERPKPRGAAPTAQFGVFFVLLRRFRATRSLWSMSTTNATRRSTLSAFCTVSSLLPGTLPAGSGEQGELLIHCLDVGQPVTADLAREEALLNQVLSGVP